MNACPFCHVSADRIVQVHGPCLAIRDLYPVTPGHLLILSRRHAVSFSDLSQEEWLAFFALAGALKDTMRQEDPSVTGFNLGFNDGPAAGQTIFHVHAHLIPRRQGDVSNPRGGVRGIIPGRSDYPDLR